MAEVTYADFAQLDIRIGQVTQAEPYPEGARTCDQALGGFWRRSWD
jgi:hypothetical protein